MNRSAEHVSGSNGASTTSEREVVDVLMVEDDEDDYFITRRLLDKARSVECAMTQAATYEDGLEALTAGEHDVCLVDYRLGGARDGLELLREANERGVSTPIILLTGQGDLSVDLGAMSAGAADYLLKDEISTAVLERSIRYALERQRAERRIRRQAALLDEAHDAISTHDLEGRVRYWNKSAERLTGYSADEVEGETIQWILKDDDQHDPQTVLQRALRTVLVEEEWSGELTLQTKDGSEVVTESRWSLVRDDAGRPDAILVINNDVTERKELETQMLRSQRMESIGRLVGGLAHDLGNLLMPITLGVKTLHARIDDDESALRTLEMIRKSAERGSDMVEQVLAFARGVEGEHARIDVRTVVEEVETMIDETVPEHIEVRVDVDDDCCYAVADATQLQQVLMNLCINARDAMRDEDGGDLTVCAETCTIDREQAERILEAEPGDYARLIVSDTGPGIPPDVLDKIFEPFFTTKAPDEGTGLGLSSAYSIIKSHDGFINVESRTGEGATFEVYLPLAGKEEVIVESGDLPELEPGDGESVLVVDDEDHVREALAKVLRQAGYTPMLAEDGTEALHLVENEGNDIAAVVTDLMMPGMDGSEVIRTLNDRHPNCPVLVSSGLSGDRPDRALEAGANEILSKPYSADTLCRTLQDLLDDQQPTTADANDQANEPASLASAES
jgi:PAS domain S-box-containing protein